MFGLTIEFYEGAGPSVKEFADYRFNWLKRKYPTKIGICPEKTIALLIIKEFIIILLLPLAKTGLRLYL